MKQILSFFALISSLLLFGCSAISPTSMFEQHGRFSLSTINHNGESKTDTGRFTYRSAHNSQSLDLLTPLSGVLAHIEITPNQACLSTYNHPDEVCRQTLTQLFEESFGKGYSLPIEHFEELLKRGTLPPSETRWKASALSHHPNGKPKLIVIMPTRPDQIVGKLSLILD